MEKETTEKTTTGGISFCGLLTIVFIVLKLTGFIGWSWWWVLAPIWAPAAFVLTCWIILWIIVAIKIRNSIHE